MWSSSVHPVKSGNKKKEKKKKRKTCSFVTVLLSAAPPRVHQDLSTTPVIRWVQRKPESEVLMSQVSTDGSPPVRTQLESGAEAVISAEKRMAPGRQSFSVKRLLNAPFCTVSL